MSAANIFQLYQLKDTPENEPVLFRSYLETIGTGRAIEVSQYDPVYERSLPDDMDVAAVHGLLRAKPAGTFSHHALSTGDIIVLWREGEAKSYFVEGDDLIPVDGFFPTGWNSSGSKLSLDTVNYKIDGKPGLWCVAEGITVENADFFLMESQVHGRKVACIVLAQDGAIVLDDVRNDFDDATQQKLLLYLHPEQAQSSNEKQSLEHYQKYFENGMYERSGSSEVTAEQNFNMIDGTHNNTRPPEKRESVRKRLREKQAQVHGGKAKTQEREKI